MAVCKIILHANKLSPAEITALVQKRLQDLGAVEIETVEDFIDNALPPTTQNALEGYADRIERLSHTLATIARDFDAPQPYTAVLDRLSQKNPNQSETALLKRLEKFTHRAPLLKRIHRFLIPLPEGKCFENLRFRQRLVKLNLNFPQIYEEPIKLDGPVLHAFENYHEEYVRLYLENWEKRTAEIQKWQNDLPELQQKITAIAALDRIPALGKAASSLLIKELEALGKKYFLLNLGESALRKNLELEPSVNGLDLASLLPETELQPFVKKVEKIFQAKLRAIREKSILKILSASGEPSVKKLTQMLKIADLEKIAKLFTPKTTGKIVEELKRLLSK